MRGGVALGEGPPLGVGGVFPTPGEPGQALFVPVVVVNVGAVEAVDDGGGVVEGLGRLEDVEGDEGAAARVGEASRVDGPASNAELTGDRGPITAILTAHVHDAGANPRLVRLLRALPCNCCHCHCPLFSFVRCGQPCWIWRGGRGTEVTRPSRDLHFRAHGEEDALD